MIEHATLTFNVTVDGDASAGVLGWNVLVDGGSTPEDHVVFDVLVDGSLSAAALASSGEQTVAMRVLVDGVVVRTVGAISVERSIERGARGSFSVPVRDDALGVTDPLGSPFGFIGAVPGKASITIEGGYVTDTGVVWLPLLTDGLADNSRRQGSGGVAKVETINVVDRSGRYDHERVSLHLDPGHGTRRDQVVRDLAADAGVTDFSLEQGGAMNKELDVDEEPFLGIGRALMEADNRTLIFDSEGSLTNPRMIPADLTDIDFTLTEARTLANPAPSVSARGDIPTRICLSGTEQIVNDECGRRTERTVIEVYETYRTNGAEARQGSGGTITTVSATEQTRPSELVERTTIDFEYDCDTLVSERTVREAWANVEMARYNRDEDDTITSYVSDVFFFDTVPVLDDSQNGFLWIFDRFVVVEEQVITHQFDPTTGFETGTVQTRSRYYNPRTARIDNTAARNVLTLGDSTGVTQIAASFQLTDRVTIEREITADGFIRAETETHEGFFARPGVDYEYADGRASSQADETFQDVRSVRTDYIALAGEGGHQVIRTQRDHLGNATTTEIETGSGHLPAAEVQSTLAASRLEVQDFEAACEAPALLASHLEREDRVTSQWVENADEGESVCERMLRESAALEAALALPANFLMREATLHQVVERSIGLAHPVWVETVRHTHTPGSPITTTVQGLIFEA